MSNMVWKVAGIKNLLKTNYQIVTDLIDLESEIDNLLSFQENWEIIKNKYVTNSDYRQYKLFCCNKVIMLNWNFCPYCSKPMIEITGE